MARLAAFDMDGTLLLPSHQLGQQTLASLLALHQRDVHLAFATGRHLLEMQILRQRITLPAWLITGNGTRVHDLEGNVLFASDLSPSVAEEVLHSRWKSAATVHVFNDEGWFTDVPVPELLQAHSMSGFSYQLRDLKSFPAHEVTKICFVDSHDALCQLKTQLDAAFGDCAHICFSALDCLEVLPLNCNKGSALAMLCQHLSLTLAECMAFGDAMNDREMLSLVGKGFVMGNAMSQLKSALPHLPVIGHCETQAVSHYLNHWMATPHLAYSPEC
ncbi:HMP-PP phosphatase [Pantoea piersonii]|uniref:HMP-PP phosphatase n=1 Tax=Pantoea piersonii TaxID=2364647 RepID=A0AAJ5U9B7_9GAMM|nr:HMP-PP phosphatase [Pantoea piersonii]WBG90125.1 HMP-PP phosphatase [Pantoea piersonii]